jgi:membrane protein DedA with SNARE-associated domain
MGNLLDGLGQLVMQYPAWSHAILGAGIILQGEVTIFVAVYLIINGNLTWPDFVMVTLGTLFVAEIFVYVLARVMRNTRFGWKYYKKLKPNKRIQHYILYLKTNMKKLLIAAKFLPGTNLVILLLAGWSKVRFGEFFRSYFTSVILWFFSMSAIAYFLMSGLHYLNSRKIFKQVEIVIAIIVVLIIFGENILRKMFRKIASLEEKAESIGDLVEKGLGDESRHTKNSGD